MNASPPLSRPAVLAAALLSIAPAAAASEPDFTGLRCTVVDGIRSAGSAFADLDGDGAIDVVEATSAGFLVSISHRGGRTFEPVVCFEFDLVASGWSLGAAIDADGDGDVDAIALRVESGVTRSLLVRNDGSSVFTSGGETVFPRILAVPRFADVNGDGLVDVLAQGGSAIDVYSGNGAGGFAFHSSIPVIDSIRAFTTLDADSDGNVDLAVSRHLPFVVEFFLGDGAGVFTSSASIATTFSVGALLDADFNGDGNVDVAMSHGQLQPYLAVHLGDGAGGFSNVDVAPTVPQFTGFTVGDFDGDGFDDLVVPPTSGLLLFRGRAAGGFEAPLLADGRIRGAAVDFDGDGRLDLVDAPSLSVPVTFGRGDGTFEFTPPVDLALGESVTSALAEDVDGDGRVDVVATERGPDGGNGRLVVRFGDGAAGFEASAFAVAGARPECASTLDFDDDGVRDVAVGKTSGTGLFLFRGDGARGYAIQSGMDLGDRVFGLAAADLTGDSIDDLLAYVETTQVVLAGDGLGGFEIIDEIPGAGVRPSALVAIADIVEDGALDIVISRRNGLRFFGEVHPNDGTGRFLPPLLLDYDAHSVADVDGDSHLDILNDTEVHFGDGSGAFAPGPTLPDSACHDREGRKGLAADMDGDGLVDLVVATRFRFAVHPGDGTGAFAPTARAFMARFETRLLADFDGDCQPDVAEGGSVLSLLLNRTLDPIEARAGNVNAAAGPIVDVLFANGSRGAGPERLVTLGVDDPLTIFMANAPSRTRSRFALYKWLVEPSRATVRNLPFGLGLMACGPPFDRGCSPPEKHLWNNIGKFGVLGTPTHASTPAPSVVLSLPEGLGRPVTWYLQGFVLDRAAPNGKAAVTNGILLRAE